MTARCRTDAAGYHVPRDADTPTWVINAVEARLDEIAEQELESNDPKFRGWLAEFRDAIDLAAFVSAALIVQRIGCRDDGANEVLAREAGYIREEYRQWRVANADEWGEIEAEVLG